MLRDCYICCAVRCAPPQNRPSNAELQACLPFLVRELELLPGLGAAVTLGHFAHRALLAALRTRDGTIRPAAYPFAHGRHYRLRGGMPDVVCSYHPSPLNTQTGRLTMPMMLAVLATALGTL